MKSRWCSAPRRAHASTRSRVIASLRFKMSYRNPRRLGSCWARRPRPICNREGGVRHHEFSSSLRPANGDRRSLKMLYELILSLFILFGDARHDESTVMSMLARNELYVINFSCIEICGNFISSMSSVRRWGTCMRDTRLFSLASCWRRAPILYFLNLLKRRGIAGGIGFDIHRRQRYQQQKRGGGIISLSSSLQSIELIRGCHRRRGNPSRNANKSEAIAEL